MNKITIADVLGMKFDWFAVDCDNNLALFSTIGSGCVFQIMSPAI